MNGKFSFGTIFILEIIRKDNLTYTNYESMTVDVKKKYKTRASNLLLLSLFITTCKQWGYVNIEKILENLYVDLEGNQNIYPEALLDAAELYIMN